MEPMPTRTPQEDAVAFLEHCIMAAANAPGIYDDDVVLQALRLVAEAFWPDLTSHARIQFNVESGQIEVETPTAFYYISVRAVER